MRADGVPIGLVTLVSFRPFPTAGAAREAGARQQRGRDREEPRGRHGRPARQQCRSRAAQRRRRPAGAFGHRRARRTADHARRRCTACSAGPWCSRGTGVHFLDLNENIVAKELHHVRKVRRSGPTAENLLRRSAEPTPAGRLCRLAFSEQPNRCPLVGSCLEDEADERAHDELDATQKLHFYQKGTFTVGNRLVSEARALGAGLDRPLQRAHLRPPRLPGLRRGARRALRHRCGDAGDRRPPDRRQRHRLPRSLHHALSGDVVADCRGCIRCSATPPRSRPGVAAAMRVKGRPEVRTIAQGGDGGTTDIGFGCLSGMFERNDDVLYICYDNEAYMNTGVQRSSATPPAARTATTPAMGDGAGQRVRHRQERAEDRRRARHSLCGDRDRRRPARPRAQGASRRWACTARATSTSTCRVRSAGARPRTTPSGWRGSRSSAACSRCSRPSTASSPAAARSAGRCRSSEYLKPQTALRPSVRGRTRQEAPRPAAGDRRPQHRRIPPARSRGRRLMEHPFAITLDVGTSLANQTGARGAPRGRSMSTGLPPCNHACPAGENIQAWLLSRRVRRLRGRLARADADNPLPAVMGRVCYHPCESACNRAQIDEAVGINSVERFLGDEAIRSGWRFEPPPAESGKRVLVVGAGPSGLSAAYHLRRMGHACRNPRGRPVRGRHDAVRHSEISPAARRARCRDRAHRRPRRRR